MDQRSVRVVVGQGDPARGALRNVLEDDGFEVVGEATVGADLAHILRAEQPDVVVLDDAIGVAAAQLVAELAPRAKLVVIWPAGVVPIGGATRVDPGEVAMALSATVGLVAGIELSGLGTIDRPDWIDKVRKDPATLREKLAMGATVPARPSVTELQRRGQRLHPSMGMGRRRRARPTPDAAPAAAVVLPIAAATTVDPTVAPTPAAEDPTETTLNRRIGMIALSGAAVAGALMIALSFGSHRQPPVLAAGPFLPPLAAPTFDPPTTPVDGSGPGAPTAPPTTGPTTTGGGATTTSGTQPGPAGGPSGPGSSGGGQTTGGTGAGPLTASAGASAANNPHGGPPGLLRLLDATAIARAHAGGHTPHGAHPEHPSHPVHTHKQ